MTSLRLTDSQRLDVLAALAMDCLNDYADESVLESSPELAALYNAAAAVAERNDKQISGLDRHAHADSLLTDALTYAVERSSLGQLWPTIRDSIGRSA